MLRPPTVNIWKPAQARQERQSSIEEKNYEESYSQMRNTG